MKNWLPDWMKSEGREDRMGRDVRRGLRAWAREAIGRRNAEVESALDRPPEVPAPTRVPRPRTETATTLP